jgi:hypothetical protein
MENVFSITKNIFLKEKIFFRQRKYFLYWKNTRFKIFLWKIDFSITENISHEGKNLFSGILASLELSFICLCLEVNSTIHDSKSVA